MKQIYKILFLTFSFLGLFCITVVSAQTRGCSGPCAGICPEIRPTPSAGTDVVFQGGITCACNYGKRGRFPVTNQRLSLASCSNLNLVLGLPVELIHFSARVETKYIRLDWATASETNNDYFSIEYSRDGRGFKEIGRVDGIGNSVENVEYSFMHETPNEGDNYYRLRQVDVDEAFEYSEIVVVTKGPGEKNVTLRPNKVTGELNVFVNKGYEKDTRASVFDLLGKRVLEVVIPAQSSLQVVDVSSLPTGQYFFRIQDERNAVALRFVKVE